MRITEIEYGKVLNDGNYGNDRLTMRAELAEDDDPTACLAELAGTVTDQLIAVEKKMRDRRQEAYRRRYEDDDGDIGL